jgi:hypothetical protein
VSGFREVLAGGVHCVPRWRGFSSGSCGHFADSCGLSPFLAQAAKASGLLVEPDLSALRELYVRRKRIIATLPPPAENPVPESSASPLPAAAKTLTGVCWASLASGSVSAISMI